MEARGVRHLRSTLISTLTFKLIVTPALITAATLAARRWGPTVGGWFAGLPLTSGPVSVFLALEQGRAFAATAARSSILGLIGVAAFCLMYARLTSRYGPARCLTLGFAAYAVMTVVARRFDAGPWPTFAVVCVVLAVALVFMPRTRAEPSEQPAPWWDLPMRIVAATTMVLAITTGAPALGPGWSGVLSPFPVFSSVLAAFAHHMSGPAAASRLQRGVVIGVFSFAAFFLVVALLLEKHSLLVTYAWASLVAVLVNAASLFALSREAHKDSVA
jgi:hypothetical protein